MPDIRTLLKQAAGTAAPQSTSPKNPAGIDVAAEASRMVSTKRMLDAATAERNERSTSRGFAKMGRGGSASGESARADSYHREMQAAAEELSRLNRKSGSDYGRYGKK